MLKELINDYSPLKTLELTCPPVGVKFCFFKPEGIEPLPRDTRMSLCEMLRHCQTENRPFYFSRENNETCVGKFLLGMEEMAPVGESGQIGERLGVFDEARANQNIYQYVPRLDRNTVNYVLFSPADKLCFEPDVLVISAPLGKSEIVMRAVTYSTGALYKSTCTPVIGCSWLLMQPYRSGEVNFIVPALVHGMHGRQLYPENTLLIGIPYRWIPVVLNSLARMEQHLPAHDGKDVYYSEFGGILSELAREAENP